MGIRRSVRAVAAAGLLLGLVGLFGAGPALAGAGCHGAAFADERGVRVHLADNCFSPAVIRVQAGQKVTWTNKDASAHTVTGVAETWGKYDELAQGKSVTYQFNSSGVFPYFCLLHPGMVGAVVVGDGTSSDTTTQSIAAPVPAATLPPAAPAAEAQTTSSTSGVSGLWKLGGIAGFALLVAALTILVLQRVGGRRAAAGA